MGGGAQTDSEGNFQMVLFPGSGDLGATPPPDSGLGQTVVNVTITDDTAITITLPATVTFSGQVVDRDGTPVPNQWVSLSGDPSGAGDQTDADGNFSIQVAPGDYSLMVSYYAMEEPLPPNVPTSYELYGGTISLAGDTSMTITLQNRLLTGTVVDPDGVPVPNVSVWPSSFDASFNGFTGYVGGGAQTDSGGNFQMVLFPGSGDLGATPPPESGFAQFVIQDVQIVGDLTLAVLLQFQSESVTVDAGPGETVTTDTEGDGATPSDPVETSVTTPNAGTVSIQEAPITEPSPEGFQFLTQQVNITAPDATVENPLVIVFRIDASRIPAGEDENTIQLFNDGVLVPACTGDPGVASPDPCVSSRTLLGDGDVEITVLTSSASAWNFGVAVPDTDGDVTCDGVVNVVDALFVLQYEVGLRVDSGGCPLPPDTLNVAVCDVNDDGLCNVVDALFILQCEVGISNTFCPPPPAPFSQAAAQAGPQDGLASGSGEQRTPTDNAQLKQQDIQRALDFERLRDIQPPGPVNPAPQLALPLDTDDDGMPDAWEVANSLNPSDPDDAWLDPDSDEVVNLFEYQLGSGLNSPATPPVATVAPSGADYTDVATAIDSVAPGTAVRVAGGIYSVNYITFSAKVVMIQGGWSPDFGERDLELYPTTFDGGLLDEILYFSISSGEPVIILDGLHFVRGTGFFGAVNLLAQGTAFMKTSIVNSSISQSDANDPDFAPNFGGVLWIISWDTSMADRTIANALIANNGATAIRSHITGDTTAHWRIINSTISHNLNGGGDNGHGVEVFTLDNGQLTSHIYNSIIWGNEETDLEFRRNITFHVDHSDIGNVNAGGGAVYLPGPGVVNVAPLFVQPGTGNFRLQATSPVIDAGTDQGIPLIDLDGQPRIAGAAVDIGPYEFTAVGCVDGDVSCDGPVNVVDALFILQYEVGLRVGTDQYPLPIEPPPPPATGWIYLPACDVNDDAFCNVVDALFILQCEVGIPNTFCPLAAAFDVSLNDTFFEPNEFTAGAGQLVTFDIINDGALIHNMHIAGPDGEYGTADDIVSTPDLVSPGETAVLEWTAPEEPGIINFRCDFHPGVMVGTITVQ